MQVVPVAPPPPFYNNQGDSTSNRSNTDEKGTSSETEGLNSYQVTTYNSVESDPLLPAAGASVRVNGGKCNRFFMQHGRSLAIALGCITVAVIAGVVGYYGFKNGNNLNPSDLEKLQAELKKLQDINNNLTEWNAMLTSINGNLNRQISALNQTIGDGDNYLGTLATGLTSCVDNPISCTIQQPDPSVKSEYHNAFGLFSATRKLSKFIDNNCNKTILKIYNSMPLNP